jgi:hypothetical protein
MDIFENIHPSIKALIGGIMFLTFFYIVSDSSNHQKHNRERLKEFIDFEINDVIVEKGIDKRNRNTPFLVGKKNFVMHENELFWNRIEIGDSVAKMKGTSLLSVYKKDTIIKLDYKSIYAYYDSLYNLGK